VDTIPPTLVNAIGSLSNNTIVTVTFSKKLDPTTATNKNNYSVNNGVVITSATLNADGLTVVLTTSPISSVCPILTVNSVQSSVGLPIAPNSQILVSVPNGTVHFQDNSSDNLLVLEAENYTFNQPGGGQAWTFTTVPPFLIPTATDTNVSGSGCMVALPNFGISYSFNPGDRPSGIPELDYVVNFTTTGTNYIWVRGSGDSDVGGANDSINLGLDGAIAYRINGVFPQAAGYAWGNTPTPATGVFTNATAGLHIINCWMREDGFGFDKLVLSSNPNYNPTGIGPAESVVQTVIGFIRSGNNVSLCWAGGGTLQASPAVSGTYTNVPNATSPYTFAPSGGQLYFRIH
jgi:hypothetical protein